jgi:hypothetical protein
MGEVLAREVLTDLVVEERNVERSDLHGEELMRQVQERTGEEGTRPTENPIY